MLRRTSGNSGGGGAGSVGHPDYYYVPHLGSIQNQITLAENAGHNAGWPAWVVVQENRTENITLKSGIYVTGGVTSGTRSPIVITGKVTVNPITGTFETNKYSLEGLSIVAGTTNGTALEFIGPNPAEVFFGDLTLTTNGTGRCLSVSNAGIGSTVRHSGDMVLKYTGTASSVYCVECTAARTYLDRVVYSGLVGCAKVVNSGTWLIFGSGEVITPSTLPVSTFECVTSAYLRLGDMLLTHNNPNKDAIWIASNARVDCVGTTFDVVPAGSSMSVSGDTSANIYLNGTNFVYGRDNRIHNVHWWTSVGAVAG